MSLLKLEIDVNKTKIIIGITVVFIVLIIMAFLPALKSGSEGYNTVKSVPQKDVASTDVTAPDASSVADEAVDEEQAPSVATVEDSVEEQVTSEESAIKEVVPTVETATVAVETAATNEPVAPDTEVATPADESTASDAAEALYSVVDGNKLDANSYNGFKLYRNWCARCHGTYGQGMVGPDLAESLKIISKEEFNDTVENGKSGTIGSMPAWKTNVQVMENLDPLYAYLKARSDGAIGVERPQKQ